MQERSCVCHAETAINLYSTRVGLKLSLLTSSYHSVFRSAFDMDNAASLSDFTQFPWILRHLSRFFCPLSTVVSILFFQPSMQRGHVSSAFNLWPPKCFYLFPALKQQLRGHRFKTDDVML